MASGSLLVDRNGLCIRAEGNLQSESSGAIAALLHAANTGDEAPTVSLESERHVTFIRQEGDHIVAVSRAAQVPKEPEV